MQKPMANAPRAEQDERRRRRISMGEARSTRPICGRLLAGAPGRGQCARRHDRRRQLDLARQVNADSQFDAADGAAAVLLASEASGNLPARRPTTHGEADDRGRDAATSAYGA